LIISHKSFIFVLENVNAKTCQMKNKTNSPEPFFILAKEECEQVGLTCIHFADLLENDDKYQYKMGRDWLEPYLKLKVKIFAMMEEGEMHDLPLDSMESFALVLCISHTYYTLKGQLNLPPEAKEKVEQKHLENAQEMWDDNKEQAISILLRLTPKMAYIDYCLQTLEDIFGLTPYSRAIKADQKIVLTNIVNNEHNKNLFLWMFSMLDIIIHYQKEWKFAYNFYHCQYIHISDYFAIKKKLFRQKQGIRIPLTLYDQVALYLTLSLVGRMFASDAAEMLDELEKRSQPEPGIMISMKDVRDFFLKASVNFLEDMRKRNQRNPEFMKLIDVVNKWEIL
jgi:hypothetical protein